MSPSLSLLMYMYGDVHADWFVDVHMKMYTCTCLVERRWRAE